MDFNIEYFREGKEQVLSPFYEKYNVIKVWHDFCLLIKNENNGKVIATAVRYNPGCRCCRASS
jgi:hypothetical protein